MVAGGVIAFYQAGYGLAAFGIGPLISAGVQLPAIFAASAAVAAVMGGCPWRSRIGSRRPPRCTLGAAHPRPGARPAVRTGETAA